MASTFSVVLSSSGRDNYYEAVAFVAAARARGRTALLFLRGAALKAYAKDRWLPPADTDLDKGMDRHLPGDPQKTLAELRSKGKVRVYACSAWVRMLDLDPATVSARVDAVIGLNAFLSQAEGGPILYL